MPLDRYADLDPFLCVDKFAVAEIFGISIRSLNRHVASGKFPKPIRVGRQNRWVLGTLREFQENGGRR